MNTSKPQQPRPKNKSTQSAKKRNNQPASVSALQTPRSKKTVANKKKKTGDAQEKSEGFLFKTGTVVAIGVALFMAWLAVEAFWGDNRAIVSIDNIEVDLPAEGLHFTLKNTGRLPATEVATFVKEQRSPSHVLLSSSGMLGNGETLEGKGGEMLKETGDVPLASGEATYRFGMSLHDLGPEGAERLRNGTDGLLVMGTISYDDGAWFRSRQTVPYCFVYNPRLSGFQWYTCLTRRIEKKLIRDQKEKEDK